MMIFNAALCIWSLRVGAGGAEGRRGGAACSAELITRRRFAGSGGHVMSSSHTMPSAVNASTDVLDGKPALVIVSTVERILDRTPSRIRT